MEITFDKFEYIEKLRASGVAKDQAVAHAEALDAALKDKVATRFDVEKIAIAMKSDIEIAKRDLKIWTGSIALVLFGVLVAINFFGS